MLRVYYYQVSKKYQIHKSIHWILYKYVLLGSAIRPLFAEMVTYVTNASTTIDKSMYFNGWLSSSFAWYIYVLKQQVAI